MIWAALYLVFAALVAFGLRCASPIFQRLNDLHWQALVMLDIVAAFVIFWPLYLLGIIAERPLAGITISALCGGAAARDVKWARKVAAVIDAIFLALTSQRDHCAKAFQSWASPLSS